MAALVPVGNQPLLQVQPAEAPSGLCGIVNKITEYVLSKWALVAASAALAGACFGILAALVTAVVGTAIASFIGNRNPVPGQVSAPFQLKPLVPAQFVAPAGAVGSAQYNVGIFNQTLEAIRTGLGLYPELHQEMLKTPVVVQPYAAPLAPPANPVATQFIVEPVTTFEMTRRLVAMGHRPLVLNMANRYDRGGAVLRGARAQEETLCRQSDLYKGLEKVHYPLPELGGAAVRGVQFFRDDEYNYVEPIVADVFTSAAYNNNLAHGRGFDRPVDDAVYLANTKEKMRTMLRWGIQNGNRVLNLSAFGCGAFRNDPNVVANAYREVFNEPEFRGAFDVVAFGIFDPPGAQHPNAPIFRNVILGA